VNGLINLLVKGQLSTLSGAAGAYLIAHGNGAGFSASQIAGALFCLGSIALQIGENYLAKKGAAQ
jgi:hypothetical protein